MTEPLPPSVERDEAEPAGPQPLQTARDDSEGAGMGPVTEEARFLDHLASAAELVGARRFREAEVEVLLALSIAPADVRGLKLLALVRFKLGRLEEARTVCRELTAALPRDAGIRLKLGLIALKLDRIEEAVQELELSASLGPEDARVWSYLGFAYARRGDRSQAAAAFRQAGQETHAAEMERDAASVVSDLPVAASTRTGAAIPQPGGESALSGPTSTNPAIDAVESPFDTSLPADAAGWESGTDPDRFLRYSGGATASVPVAPLVGYAVARLAPPAGHAWVGGHPAWVGSTACLPIGEEIFVRGDAAVACTGTARWEIAQRRVRGRETTERLGGGQGDGAGQGRGSDEAAGEQEAFFRVTGEGEVFVGAPAAAGAGAGSGTGRLVPLLLEDDILYVREDRVLAFEGKLPWEYGQVPRGGVRMLQFRGRGLVAIRVDGEPGAVKVTPMRPLLVSTPHLLGWIGRVVAQGVAAHGREPAAEASGRVTMPFGISCEGEGVVLVDVRSKNKERS